MVSYEVHKYEIDENTSTDMTSKLSGPEVIRGPDEVYLMRGLLRVTELVIRSNILALPHEPI